MAVDLAPAHQKMIETVAKSNGFDTYELHTEPGSEKGDGYSGSMVRTTISDGDRKLKLVLKLAHPVENPFLASIYLKEIYIYETVFDAFERFQLENGHRDGFNFHAKFYGKCEENQREALAMENLIESGLRLWERKVPMNSQHISLVLQEYGKLHAVSMAMREKDPKGFTRLVDGIESKQFVDDKFKWYEPLVSGVRKVTSNADDVKVREGVNRAIEASTKFFEEDFENPQYKLVISHGDCWSNNIFFKYDDPTDKSAPTKVCLIDWQMSRLTSPAMDLSYFIGCNSPKEILDEHEKYLKIYHDSLSRNLRAMGCDPELIFPYSKLMEHWRIFGKYIAYLAPLIFVVQMVDKEDAVDVTKIEKPEDFVTLFREAGNDRTDARMKEVFTFLVENDLL